MITDALAKISAAAIVTLSAQLNLPVSSHVISSHEISLEKRYYPIQKDNILLNLAYMRGITSKDVNWDEVKKPFKFEFKLDPNKTFAFHDDILDQYKDKIEKTTNAHFSFDEGFKSAGYLVGDGVCHLASLIYWAAKDAGLDANAPTNHDFMPIPEISREYGVSIYSNPLSKDSNSLQNLYITNNKGKEITFKFDYNQDKLKVSVEEAQ